MATRSANVRKIVREKDNVYEVRYRAPTGGSAAEPLPRKPTPELM